MPASRRAPVPLQLPWPAAVLMQRILGRSDDVNALDARVAAGHPLITVCGAPGVGKSWVAAAWCIDRGEGVSWVALDGVHEVEQARELIAQARAKVVVLDGADGLHAHGVKLLGEWMLARPGTQWVVTSRRPLGMRAEEVLDVHPLSEADACELFRRSAGADTRSDDDVKRIVSAVGCLPLAVGLAAQRYVLSAAALCVRLDDDVDILRSHQRDALPRHASMDGCIRPSWDALGDDGKRALRACAVFAGTFSAEDAAAVLELPVDAAAALLHLLHEHRLLHMVPAPAGETRMALHAVIRAFARARLRDDGGDALHRAHAELVLSRCEPLVLAEGANSERSSDPQVIAFLERWFPDLRAMYARFTGRDDVISVRTVLCMQPLLHIRGPHAAFASMLRDAVETSRRVAQPVLLARALASHAMFLARRGQALQARDALAESYAIHRRGGSGVEQAAVLWLLGYACWKLGKQQEAETHARTLLHFSRSRGYRFHEANAKLTLGRVLAARNEPAQARACFDEAQAIYRALGAHRQLAISVLNVGLTLVMEGHPERALVHLHQALRFFEGLGDVQMQTRLLVYVGGTHRMMQQPDLALQLCGKALALSEACDDGESAVLALLERAETLLELGQARDALDDAETALERMVLLERGAVRSGALALCARAYEALGDAPRARGLRAEADACASTERLLPSTEPSAPTVLVVQAAGAGFRMGAQEPVSLERRRALKRILARLVEERWERPGHGLDWQQLLAAGWPGEKVLPEAAQQRVYTSVCTLRRMGLGAHLRTNDEGYLLDPALQVRAEG